MKNWIVDHENDIKRLKNHVFVIDDKNISVKYIVIPALLDGKCRKAVYTAALEESVRMGHTFKIHGATKKMDYRTCWVGLIMVICNFIQVTYK